MIDLYLLEQFIALDQYKTLSCASEHLHLTQPTLTRSMQKLEDEIGVSLFNRSSRRLQMNQNGKLLVHYAKRILKLEQEMFDVIQRQDKATRILTVGISNSVSQQGVRNFLSELINKKNGRRSDILSQPLLELDVREDNELLQGLINSDYPVIFLHYAPDNDRFYSIPFLKERLFFSLLPSELPNIPKEGIHFSELNGMTFLSPKGSGAWDEMIAREMPDSHIIFQDDQEDINDILSESNIHAFITDIGMENHLLRPGRITVPIADKCATFQYYAVALRKSPIGMELMKEIKKKYKNNDK